MMYLVKMYNGFGQAKWVPVRAKSGFLALMYINYRYSPDWKSEVAVDPHLLTVNDGFRGWKFRRLRK